MKNCLLLVLFCFCLVLTVSAQSSRNRPQTTDNTGKANKRETPKTEPSPTPTPEPTPTEDANTNKEPVLEDSEVTIIDTKLINVPFKVLDRDGRFVPGLKKEDFEVYENNVKQEIAYFSTEAKPFTVVLLLDVSPSTKFKIHEIQSAAIDFTKQLRDQDKVTVIAFNETVMVLCEPTNNREQLQSAIKRTQFGQGTSLYEAVDFALRKQLAKIAGRKAVVLFTDGVDTSSRIATFDSTLNDATEKDVLIYPIQYGTYADVQKMKQPGNLPFPNPSPTPTVKSPLPEINLPIPRRNDTIITTSGDTPEEYEKAGKYLQELSFRTGGKVYRADSIYGLGDAFTQIAAELRQYYSLAYYPPDDAKTGKRKIKVKSLRPNLAVKAREGYTVSDEKTKSKK